MQIICRFLTSYDIVHHHYPTESSSKKLGWCVVKLRNCGLHWEAHWTDHANKPRTHKWPASRVIVKRRMHVVLVRVLPSSPEQSKPIDIFLEIIGYDHWRQDGTV